MRFRELLEVFFPENPRHHPRFRITEPLKPVSPSRQQPPWNAGQIVILLDPDSRVKVVKRIEAGEAVVAC